MANNLDKSLDEIIKANKPVRKDRTNNRKTPYESKSYGGAVGRSVYVGNLSWQTDWMALKDYMRKAGSVAHADVLEHDDGKSKGCAIVKYETAEGAKNAIATLNDTNLDGRPIFVREDREAGNSRGGGGRGGRGNFNSGGGRGARYGEPVFSPHSNMAQKIRNSAPANCTVYVGNLPWAAEWQELKDICSKFGSVGRADVEKEDGGRSKGYGIAVFDNASDAAKCIKELDGATYEGRELNVKLDKIRSSGQMYGRRGQGGFGNFGGGNRGFGGGNRGFGGGNRGFGGTKVYVGNLPWSVEWQDLKDLCRNYGDVTRAEIPDNKEGKSRGFGIVTFTNSADAQNCVNNLNGMLLDGRDLNVRFDREN